MAFRHERENGCLGISNLARLPVLANFTSKFSTSRTQIAQGTQRIFDLVKEEGLQFHSMNELSCVVQDHSKDCAAEKTR